MDKSLGYYRSSIARVIGVSRFDGGLNYLGHLQNAQNAKGGTCPAFKRSGLVEVAYLSLFFELLFDQQLRQLRHDFPGDFAHDLI